MTQKMETKINCQFCDRYFLCTHPARKKFLWLYRKQCVYAEGSLSIGQTCLIQKRFPESSMIQEKHKRLNPDVQICVNCESYNPNWEKEWNEKKYSWCNDPEIHPLDDRKSEKLGYCSHFKPRNRK